MYYQNIVWIHHILFRFNRRLIVQVILRECPGYGWIWERMICNIIISIPTCFWTLLLDIRVSPSFAKISGIPMVSAGMSGDNYWAGGKVWDGRENLLAQFSFGVRNMSAPISDSSLLSLAERAIFFFIFFFLKRQVTQQELVTSTVLPP